MNGYEKYTLRRFGLILILIYYTFALLVMELLFINCNTV
jgi:hypothetical protein